VTTLITGMSGFVGAHLARLIQQNGDDAVPLDLEGEDPVDLLDPEAVETLIKKTKPGRVYHLAAMSSVARSWKAPETTFDINVKGTDNVLGAVAKHAAKARVLVVSSGGLSGRPISEDDQPQPENPYARSKLEAESHCLLFFQRRGFDVRRVRPMGHVGPGQKLGFVAPDLASQAAAIKKGKAPPKIKVGALDIKREFADVRDVVRAYRLIIEQGEPGGVYNLATNRPRSIEELAQAIIEAAGIEAELVQEQERIRKLDESSPALDTERIKALGFKYEIPFEKTIDDVVEEWMNKEQT